MPTVQVRLSAKLTAAVAAVLAVVSLGLAVLLRGFQGIDVLVAWIGIFATLWLPVSIWLLARGSQATSSQRVDDNAQQAQRQVELFKATRRDTLTGLLSRPVFLEMLAGLVAGGKHIALLIVDIDKLGHINSTYGDSTGDDLLRAFADRLRTLAGQGEHVARLDGDEFALVLDKPDELKALEKATAHVMRSLTEPYPASGILIDVAVSVGAARAPEHGTNTESLMQAARVALKQAKADGGGWKLCGKDDSEELRQRAQYRGELSQAIESGQIIPYYQPIISLPGGEIAKFEVLARWNHPTAGLLEPASFIPLAEELGLLGHLSMELLRQVALDSMELPKSFRFAINVSAAQLREFISFVRDQPGEWQRRMDLSRLDVELTENALTRDRELARELIDVLHTHGARAGLDQFGTGYSNFFHLREMEFDYLKIGKEFIVNLLEDPRAESCVMAMLWLGHGLAIDMVADGVETKAVADRLGKMGCHFAQGFLYSRPVPAAEVAELLKSPALGPGN
jgi:diguanylate cyclase (GGDEF)-like protein